MLSNNDLAKLLSERKEMRELCRAYMQAKVVPILPSMATAEAGIAALVLGPLKLDKRDECGSDGLAQVVSGAVVGYTTFQLIEQAELIFFAQHGVYTQGWHPLVKARILDLVAPLDYVLAQKAA